MAIDPLHIHPPEFEIDPSRLELRLSGDWTVEGLAELERRLRDQRWPSAGAWTLHTREVDGLDTAGARLIGHISDEFRSRGVDLELGDVPARHRGLLELVGRLRGVAAEKPRSLNAVQRLGQRVIRLGDRSWNFLAFVGEFTAALLPRLAHPLQLRWRQVINEIQQAGVAALPIVGLLAFLMGIVIAYQGGIPLKDYGANIFIVDLVAITMLREMAPMLTAIVVAGRTGSSYTAQIGTMKITEEIDALRTMGITPFDMLVLPKFLALLIALPLLTVFADILGLIGGALIADNLFGVGYGMFFERVPLELSPSNFWVGIAKAPVFAALITLIGCHQGFRVSGSAEAIGQATTTSVVQGIFFVITADALFSIAFNMAGL